MAFCKKCGAELAPDLRFCEKCGAEVIAAAPPPKPVRTATIPKWQIYAPYVGLVVSILVSYFWDSWFGFIIALVGGVFAIRSYRARKTGLDILGIVAAAMGVLVCFIFLIIVYS